VARYQVEETLGAGGMAVVYRARDEELGRLVALKVLAPALAADEEFRRRFTAESRAAAAVDHPHIIPVYEAGQAGWALFIAMRLVTGGDLWGVIGHGPLAPERVAELLSPVASALDAAHRAGLVHRDVKPGNVLVDTDQGRPEHVYLSDFGISKGAASSAGLTGTGQYLGTPDYTSPEQVRGLPVDGRTDQYALACVAWQLLTGSVPFHRDEGLDVLFAHLHEPVPRLDALRPDLPAAGQVLVRALAKEPGRRYPSCGEFTDALREAFALPPYRPGVATAAGLAAAGPAQDPAVPGQRDSRPGLDGNPARRRRYLTLTLAGTLLATATAIALLLAMSGGPRPPAGPQAGTTSRTASAERSKPATVPTPLAGTLAATLANPASQGVRAVAFASNGTTLAAGAFSNTSTAYLWDTVTRKITATLSGPSRTQVTAVAFSPDGTTLAVGDLGGTTYLWNTATHRITRTLADPRSTGVSAVAFAPDGTTVAVGDDNGNTFLWDVADGKVARTLVDPIGAAADAVAFARDGTRLAVGDGDGSTYLWDTRTGKILTLLPLPGRPEEANAVAFSPDGVTLATGDQNGGTYLWDTATRVLSATVTYPPIKGVNAVAFSPDGTTVVIGDEDGNTYLWDIAAGQIAATLSDPGSLGVTSVAFSLGGATLAAGDQNGNVYLWRISGLARDNPGPNLFSWKAGKLPLAGAADIRRRLAPGASAGTAPDGRAYQSARLDLAHRAETVVRGVDVDDLRLRGHQVGRGLEEPLHVGLPDVRAARVGILEALDADELVVVGKAPGELEEQAAVLGVDVMSVGVGHRQPLVHLLGPDLHLDVDQDHGLPSC
jgi:serine/threonine-protein kinase